MDRFHTQSGGLKVTKGHEASDFSIRGIVVFAVCLAVGLVFTFLLAGAILRIFEWGEKKWFDTGLTPVQQQLQKERGLVAEPRTGQYPGEKERQLRPTSESEQRARVEQSMEKTFAQPRLQYDDVYEMNTFRKSENDRLNSFAKDADGNVYIPISRAIDLLAQRGLPAVSGKWSPTAPVAVPAGESRSSSHEAKTPRGAIKGVTR